ncbi:MULTISPECIES: AAA family ATPase [Rhodococcus]|uniref:AAA family ATPase n=1 Tax=Rhodococcus TaxID=1827 RepID=UPI0029539852|nr:MULTISPECIES: AAA family ATPase [Rhodococcus]MDV7246262.1 AAA family ATPase [Rhodococcus oxybenzonivorans]MDV7337266.1 AAA family ATPase [Rhodococcus oxybenzonivorans]MDV8030746.1 AAA family ATPase [Rhodococcus sp. IEGM 27]
MDLDEVVSRAQLILAALSRYQGGADVNSVITLSYENDPAWQGNPAQMRVNMRALDLLRRLGFIRLQPNGYAYELSETGRSVSTNGWPTTLAADWLEEWVETEQLLEALNEQRTSSENTIDRLQVHNWRQFSDIELTFHPRVTILTGANGAGKTTLLNILAPHFNWSAQLLTRRTHGDPAHNSEEVGELSYTNGGRSPLILNPSTGVSSTPLTIPQMQTVPGLFINSHRSVSAYQPLNALPPRFSEWETLQQQFAGEIQIRYSGGSSQFSPLYRMKEALVAAAMWAYGSPAVRPNDSARKLWEGYQSTLKRFLPRSLRFKELQVEDSEIILVTEGAQFPLEAASGGISAMLELSWQIFLRQGNQQSFTVCLDEPENHLHPELQRSIVPSLLAGFPNVSFIIATHSPFVVTSVKDCFVYVLGPNSRNQITSHRMDNINSSATPDETLMSVLGLDTTLPLWAEDQLSALMDELPASPSSADLRSLREQLKLLGLDRQFPAAVRSLGGQQ